MKYLFSLFLFLVSTSCAIKVNSIYDHNVEFDKYKTFCWLEGCEFSYTGPSYLDDSIFREHTKSSIVEELILKGLHQDNLNPDLLIDFHISVDSKTMVIYHEDEYDEYHIHNNEENREYIDYLQGTLIIDIVDKDQGRMIWRSAAVRYMDINPDLTKSNIRKGVAKALKDYPPKENH